MRKRPGAGWRLLVALLPNQHEISMPTPRPSWRDWALTWSHGVSIAEFWHQAGPAAHCSSTNSAVICPDGNP